MNKTVGAVVCTIFLFTLALYTCIGSMSLTSAKALIGEVKE
ncbi:MAG: hypothetical protein ABSF65_06310 [Candidatus Bathyarchaeia archaeon]|jgi:hypothetical protein